METKKWVVLAILICAIFSAHANGLQNNNSTKKDTTALGPILPPLVYKFDIKEQIAPAIWRQTQQAIDEAIGQNANYIIIHMNTYGGMVESADSIRTKILNCPIPVYVFIDNNAASAGALISIACDSIFMRKGANIGAATVVTAKGEQLPDKYQSYMRSTMRSTAEAHGKVKEIVRGDTIERWFRDPQIAEAMVDDRLSISGVIDSGKVLTFTTSEAIAHHFCEAEVENIDEILEFVGVEKYEIVEYNPTTLEKLIGFMVNPVFQGILIMIIIGGIYFELQTPGIGFPIAASAIAAVLYFAPLYLEGLAANWEILIFILGIGLVAVELFAIPGFGITGITGFIMMVLGLALSMVNNFEFVWSLGFFIPVSKAIMLVLVSMAFSLIISIYLTKKMFSSNTFEFLSLHTEERKEDGFIGVQDLNKTHTGKQGTAYTILRPAGKVEIEGNIYDAKAISSYIDKGQKIEVVRQEAGQLYVQLVRE